MVDTFVLSVLSRPLTIGDKEYMVAWDAQKNHAVIVVIDEDGLHDLETEDMQMLSFPRELDAHRYLVGLKHEVDGPSDDSWRNL